MSNMLGLILPPDVTPEEMKEFADYFTAIGAFLKERGIDIFGDEIISKAINHFSIPLSIKLIKYMRAGNLGAGVNEILDIINEIMYVENLREYVEDRYHINLQSNMYVQALLSALPEWHNEMMILAKKQASYEEGYRATMSIVKEYWIQQPAQGRA